MGSAIEKCRNIPRTLTSEPEEAEEVVAPTR